MNKTTRNIRNWLTASLIVAAACSLSSRAYSSPAPGADTFKSKCAMCHGPDGSGKTPMGEKLNIRDLRSPDVQKQSDADLTAIISNGKSPMPAYGKSLSSAEIRDVVAFIRSMAKS